MATQKNTYLLLVIVLVIWGLIAYKIYRHIAPKDRISTGNTGHYSYHPHTASDTFTYVLHTGYRDPFLGTLPKKHKKMIHKKHTKPPLKKNKIKHPFPGLTYRGLVNPKTAKRERIFMIEINGKNELFKIGQRVSGVKLLNGNENEVQIQFQDSILKISLKP